MSVQLCRSKPFSWICNFLMHHGFSRTFTKTSVCFYTAIATSKENHDSPITITAHQPQRCHNCPRSQASSFVHPMDLEARGGKVDFRPPSKSTSDVRSEISTSVAFWRFCSLWAVAMSWWMNTRRNLILANHNVCVLFQALYSTSSGVPTSPLDLCQSLQMTDWLQRL